MSVSWQSWISIWNIYCIMSVWLIDKLRVKCIDNEGDYVEKSLLSEISALLSALRNYWCIYVWSSSEKLMAYLTLVFSPSPSFHLLLCFLRLFHLYTPKNRMETKNVCTQRHRDLFCKLIYECFLIKWHQEVDLHTIKQF